MRYPPLVLVVLLAALLTACASPRSDQGQGQGGTTGPQPFVTVSVVFQGPVRVESTGAPTAAPSATSAATATQPSTATATPALNLGDSAIKAVVPTVPVLGPDGTVAPPR
jgi:hypothetical protein